MIIEYPVEIAAPDLSRFEHGGTGIPYVHSFDSGAPGPDALITALTHGNELCGVHALLRLFEAEVWPVHGRLTLAFVNVAAYRRFDRENPRASRYLDEDFNRVWSPELLGSSRRTRELIRAREILPLVRRADFLLDLHSMQLRSPALALVGEAPKGREFARRMGYPTVVVADRGHRNGVRMRDFGRFGDPDEPATAILVECGQHWARSAVEVAITSCRQFLDVLGIVDRAALERIGTPPEASAQRFVEVTDPVTVAHGPFEFVEPFQGLEVIEQAGTVIAHDGGRPIRTPYDRCVLIMPSQRLTAGLTAVRLGRLVA